MNNNIFLDMIQLQNLLTWYVFKDVNSDTPTNFQKLIVCNIPVKIRMVLSIDLNVIKV